MCRGRIKKALGNTHSLACDVDNEPAKENEKEQSDRRRVKRGVPQNPERRRLPAVLNAAGRLRIVRAEKRPSNLSIRRSLEILERAVSIH